MHSSHRSCGSCGARCKNSRRSSRLHCSFAALLICQSSARARTRRRSRTPRHPSLCLAQDSPRIPRVRACLHRRCQCLSGSACRLISRQPGRRHQASIPGREARSHAVLRGHHLLRSGSGGACAHGPERSRGRSSGRLEAGVGCRLRSHHRVRHGWHLD